MRSLVPVILLSLLVVACSSDKKAPMKGDRIPVMQFATADKADEGADQAPIELAAVSDLDWSVPGADAAHLPGNLAFGSKPLQKIWSASVGEGSSEESKLMTTPVTDQARVYTADTEGEIRAFDINSGKRIWETAVLSDDETATVSPGLALDGGRLYVTDGIGHLLALSSADGKVVWKRDLEQPVRSAPTVLNGQVYLITLNDETLALSAETGEQVWKHEGIQESAGLLGAPSPAAQDSVIVTVYSSGDVAALRAETGVEAWADNLTGGSDFQSRSVTQLAGFRGHPVIDQEVVIVGNASNRTVAVHIPSGERIWQKEFGLTGMPWVSGNMVFALTSNNDMVAMVKQSGQIRWTRHLQKFEDEEDKEDPIFWSGPVMGNGRLFVAGSNEELLEIDVETGKTLRKTGLPDPVMTSPVISRNTLFVVTEKGDLVAYR